jgi:6-phosphogluconolactonase
MTEPRAAVSWAKPGDAAAVADRIGRELARSTRNGGGAKRIAVPGGSTPLRVFDLLAARQFDWSGATLVLTDDRQVPPSHPASNFGRLAAALGEARCRIAPLTAGEPVEPFDLVWLGMGADGHVASLFPRMIVNGEGEGPRVIATVPDPLPPEARFPRLSLNLAALVRTREIILVVTGEAKRALLEQVLAGGAPDLPVARLVWAATCPLTIYWSP